MAFGPLHIYADGEFYAPLPWALDPCGSRYASAKDLYSRGHAKPSELRRRVHHCAWLGSGILGNRHPANVWETIANPSYVGEKLTGLGERQGELKPTCRLFRSRSAKNLPRSAKTLTKHTHHPQGPANHNPPTTQRDSRARITGAAVACRKASSINLHNKEREARLVFEPF